MRADLFYSYMKGWADGASHAGYRDDYVNHDNPDVARMYNDGYRVGRQAYRQAGVHASELTGFKPSIVRLADE